MAKDSRKFYWTADADGEECPWHGKPNFSDGEWGVPEGRNAEWLVEEDEHYALMALARPTGLVLEPGGIVEVVPQPWRVKQ